MPIGIVRAHLAAATAAVVGASALAITPVAENVALPVTRTADVTLTQIGATLRVAYGDLFAPFEEPCTDCYPPDQPPAVAGIGLFTAAVANSVPILNQVSLNVAAYLGAFATLPAEEAATRVLAEMVANAKQVTAAVAGLVARAVPDCCAMIAAVAQAAATATRFVVEALMGGSLAAVWRAFDLGFIAPLGVDGLVTSSVPGTVLAVSIGPGIGTYGTPGYVASSAVLAQEAQATIVRALGGAANGTPAFTPVAAAAARKSSRAAASVRAKAKAVVAPTAAADLNDTSATTESDPIAKPAATHRASRVAARAAARN
jgi:hypothetical protein